MTPKTRGKQRPTPDHWALFFERKGIRSVAHLAELTGVAGMTANRLVYGDSRTSPEVLRQVARALKVDDAVIYGLAGWPTTTHPWEPPAEAEAMDERQRKAVTEMIRAFVRPALEDTEEGPGATVSDLRAKHPEQGDLRLAAWKRDGDRPSLGEHLDTLGEEPQA
jgi:hypothetical protein